MKPYGLIADVHCHNWNAFSRTNENDLNSRLAIILDEMLRAAKEVLNAGGDTLYIAGDLFHVRGSVAPSVLNPVKDTFDKINQLGVLIIILPGNHDLEGKRAARISNAVTALEGPKVIVTNDVADMGNVYLVPWIEDINLLKSELNDLTARVMTGEKSGKRDLILHAPIDGVIPGLPCHGLDAGFLAGLGFDRVFAGHYHNHKDFGNGVYSIGAIAHHTWSDPGSKAGFLIVTDEEVKYFASHAPEFVDIAPDMDKAEVELLAEGNYVRAKIRAAKNSEIEAARKWLNDCGAKGVVIQVVKESARVRTSSTIKAGASIETSVGEFITTREDIPHKEEVTRAALNVLAEAGA